MTVWWSKAILIGGVIAALCILVGALGSKFGIWTFQGGFMMLAAGVVLAALAVILGLVALFVANKHGLDGDKPGIYMGAVVGLLVLGVMGLQFATASSVPPIHNISTDVTNPPAFDKVVALRAASEGANPLEYDASKLAELQQVAYPDVKSLSLTSDPAAALAAAQAALEDMGLEIVNVNAAAGIVEATATTFWFGFKDDMVVRVQPDAAGSRVDVRSVSRVGQSDLGANARRIVDLLGRLSAS